ncbi:aldehyde dehydrogenase (NAD+) [Paraburkholderia sp. BL6665CI2N2]|uniref:aldehyde dehydrogenase family protein n=1 Tax=Paraburkholderia sp. BL6665CI2N2 TaxID=1938806 RepID=UPI0010F2B60E|nr:aldehyde dehydrogenase family protein [Paraburkholderia sp. BL6665CI2N2]TDY16754.1 aldehyde dehydrogenase (NAD+) [Paraburkholderia sp. BL6665CI2N2]
MKTSQARIKDILDTMEYGPAPESTEVAMNWLDERGRRFDHFIDGAFVAPADGAHFDVVNPADESLLAQVAQGGAADVNAAVEAARRAFRSWSTTPGHERARLLYAIARHVQKHARFLAVLESLDNGKPIRESRDIDVPLVARHFYHHAGWAELIGDEFPNHGAVGVCGQIIPWNFPLLMLAWKIAPALAAGNTVVLKPAEFTPLTALAFAEICQQVGLPAGVVNVVTGDGATGALIVEHLDVDKVAFTGSTEVGRAIRRATAGTGKKLSLELGGKSPFIVFEDADLDAAVEGVVDSIWFNQGQVCCAGSRILVQEGVAELFHAKLRARMSTLRVGDPLDKSTDIGAVVDRIQLERITALVQRGVAEGATCFQPPMAVRVKGFFYPPTLVTDVETTSVLVREEVFGPVVTSSTFRTPDEAIALANDTRYGLAASVWSENLNRTLEVAAAVKAGVVWVNSANQFDAAAGFGGYRESGYGREGGREGMLEYLMPRSERGEATSGSANRAQATNVPVVHTPVPLQDLSDHCGNVDRTAKLYIGGKQTRPDSGYSYRVFGANGAPLGLAPLGNRKDVRNAVEAARKASGWSGLSGHARAQVIYYLAENLSARKPGFAALLRECTGASEFEAAREVELGISRLFRYAALADKYDGRVHSTLTHHVTLAMNEPWGVLGVACPEDAPLIGLVSLIAPAMALGNRVVAVVSQTHPLVATEFYQLLDTSDVPDGVVNLLSGPRGELVQALAAHNDVDAFWYSGDAAGRASVEAESAGNLKPVWSPELALLAEDGGHLATGEFARHALQVKNIWVPYGE